MEKARTLGLVWIALGFIELGWALFCVFGGLILTVVGFADDELGALMWLGGGAYGVLALFEFPIAALHLFTGYKLRQGTGLILAIASIAACMPQMVFALYCSPFELIAMVAGLVILLDPDVRKALDG